jgi:hypothetical protein
MRYGKVMQGEWSIEFHFNWRENKYSVFAWSGDEEDGSLNKAQAVCIGMVWKNPKKSRRKPCWEALIIYDNDHYTVPMEYPQMRDAGLALLEEYIKTTPKLHR